MAEVAEVAPRLACLEGAWAVGMTVVESTAEASAAEAGWEAAAPAVAAMAEVATVTAPTEAATTAAADQVAMVAAARLEGVALEVGGSQRSRQQEKHGCPRWHWPRR